MAVAPSLPRSSPSGGAEPVELRGGVIMSADPGQPQYAAAKRFGFPTAEFLVHRSHRHDQHLGLVGRAPCSVLKQSSARNQAAPTTEGCRATSPGGFGLSSLARSSLIPVSRPLPERT